MVDLDDAFFKIDSGLNGAKDFVGSAEDPGEKLELGGEELEDALVGGVLGIEKVDDDDVVLLPITMTATDALLDTLGIPGEVVVDHEGAKLKVDALGGGLGGDHDAGVVAKVVDEGLTNVGGAGAGGAVGVGEFLFPVAVDFVGARVVVRTVEESDFSLVAVVDEELLEVVLGLAGLGEDDRFLGGLVVAHSAEAFVEGKEKGGSLGVFSDPFGKVAEGFEFADFLFDGFAFTFGEELGEVFGFPLIHQFGEPTVEVGLDDLVRFFPQGGVGEEASAELAGERI